MPPAKEDRGSPLPLLHSTVPIPDPTTLTTQQMTREIAALKELFTAQLESLGTEIKTRLDGMDKAIDLVRLAASLLPDHVDEKIDALRQVQDEKCNSIQTQFHERDVRTEQSGKDAKTAVDAALQAAKEAV